MIWRQRVVSCQFPDPSRKSASIGVHLRFKRGYPRPVGGCKNEPNLVRSNVRNKPNSSDCGLQIADCAKRTQFPAGEIPQRSTVLSFHHSRQGRVGRGPGDEGQMCKTKPKDGSRQSVAGRQLYKQTQLPGASGTCKYCAGRELW